MRILKNQLNRITENVRPKEMIPTNRGMMSGREWIEQEAKRITAKGRPAFIHQTEDGRLFLARRA